MDTVFFYGFPAGALFIGAVAVVLSIRASRAFDRAFGEAVVLKTLPRETALKSTTSRTR